MTKPKYCLKELFCYGTNPHFPPLPLQGVCVDSRLAQKGDLFCALPGAQTDGHHFLAEVAAKGCEAALVHKAYSGPDYGMFLIKVEDTLRALQDVARNLLAVRRPKIVGVTGSVGKTTTKDFIIELLKKSFRLSFSPRNSNSQIGLPLAILNHTDGQEEVLVLEMGMTHHGQLRRLIEIAPPHVALITTVALVHAGNFESLEDIARAKAEIFEHPKTSIGLLDRRIGNYDELSKVGACQKLSFAVDCLNADFSLTSDNLVKGPESSHLLNYLNLLGTHNRHNFLAAVAAARCLKIDWNDINLASQHLQLPERRLQIVEKLGITFINDSYNASEISVKAALNSLPQPKKRGRKIAVLGEMPELGKFSIQCHVAVGQFALDKVDLMVCFGENCQPIVDVWIAAGKPVELHSDRNALIETLRELLQADDVVLLKGANTRQLWKILDEI